MRSTSARDCCPVAALGIAASTTFVPPAWGYPFACSANASCSSCFVRRSDASRLVVAPVEFAAAASPARAASRRPTRGPRSGALVDPIFLSGSCKKKPPSNPAHSRSARQLHHNSLSWGICALLTTCEFLKYRPARIKSRGESVTRESSTTAAPAGATLRSAERCQSRHVKQEVTMFSRELMYRSLPALLLGLLALPVHAQSFRVQCPTDTVTHPAALHNNSSEPAYNGPTTLAADAAGFLKPTAHVNGAIKRQQISGADGYSTMGDGTQTYMFSFGPLSGLADIANGQPGTEFPSVFNTVYAGTPLQPGDPATTVDGSGSFTYNGAVGLVPETYTN